MSYSDCKDTVKDRDTRKSKSNLLTLSRLAPSAVSKDQVSEVSKPQVSEGVVGFWFQNVYNRKII